MADGTARVTKLTINQEWRFILDFRGHFDFRISMRVIMTSVVSAAFTTFALFKALRLTVTMVVPMI
jgi:hypothetical protein